MQIPGLEGLLESARAYGEQYALNDDDLKADIVADLMSNWIGEFNPDSELLARATAEFTLAFVSEYVHETGRYSLAEKIYRQV